MNAGSDKKRSFSECVDLSIDEESNDVPDLNESIPVASNRAVMLNQTNSSVEFRVFGTPEVLERHRVGKNKHCYNPSKAKQADFLAQCEGFFNAGPFKGPVAVSLTFHFKRPLYHYGSGRNCNVLKPGSDVWHTKAKGMVTDGNTTFPQQAMYINSYFLVSFL